jgi:hypothetical protein
VNTESCHPPTQLDLPMPNDPRVAKALRRAAVRATRAPSVHNTQPWQFLLSATSLEIVADLSRQLQVLDPRGRQLLMSCGCAVFNARVAVAASGVAADVQRFPDPLRSTLLARIVADPARRSDGDGTIAHLDPAIDARQTNRQEFTGGEVPPALVDVLVEAAAAEGCELVAVVKDEHRLALAELSRLADRTQNADPAYQAELRQWTSDDPGRVDGVPSTSVPRTAGARRGALPLRDFGLNGAAELPAHLHESAARCVLILGTDQDGPAAWLRAGEALERVLLEIARAGYAASPLNQVIEVPRTHEALRTDLGLAMHPHIVLRVGRAAAVPATRRRRLVDVITEAI